MKSLLIASCLLGATSTAAAMTGDSARGQKLHDANCLRCHTTSVYTRPDRKIHSLDALRQQVDACTQVARVILSDDEQRDLVKYLNEQFYRFK